MASLAQSTTMVFPLPQKMTAGATAASISPSSFKIITTSTSQILAGAITRYQQLIFPFHPLEPNDKATSISTLKVVVTSDNEVLQFGVDEHYSLTIDESDTSLLAASTIWGAMHGLETFSQLVQWDDATSSYKVMHTPISIEDSPRFPWRGLMIDTARHFLTKATILRTIDSLAYNKFNTLHWHITDAESFPMQSATYPLLAQKGAYSPRATYSPQDVLDIVNYAHQRGVRILPEFDIPGHAASWGKGYNITVYCPHWNSNINNIPLDPSNPQTFEILDGFLTEMAGRFADDFFHVGGDEVEFVCWEDNPQLMQWAKNNGFTTSVQIEQYFETKLQKIIAKTNKTMVCWQELFNNGISLPADTVIEVWKDARTLQQVINGGHRAVAAFAYYLDKQMPNPNSTHYEWVDTWQDFYNADPFNGITGNNKNLILGGEACMFAEQVDATNFDSRVWPRACGVAERLWSAQSVTDIADATSRLIAFRCRLAQRGIGAGPIKPDFCPLPDTSRFVRMDI
jgi:hexosaminidase